MSWAEHGGVMGVNGREWATPLYILKEQASAISAARFARAKAKAHGLDARPGRAPWARSPMTGSGYVR